MCIDDASRFSHAEVLPDEKGVTLAFSCTFTEDLRLGWWLTSQLSACRVGPSVKNLFSIHS